MIANSKVVADDLGSFCFNHGQHAVAERCDFRLRVLLGPVIKLALGEHVARLREGRHPASVFQSRVPADMIDMQMRAHHEIDVADGNARGAERAHVGVVGLQVPFRAQRPRLVVADAAIDQDGVVRRPHDVGLEAQDQHVVVIDRAGLFHPRLVLSEPLRRECRQHVERGQERGFLLDDAVNAEIAGGQFETHGFSFTDGMITLARMSSCARPSFGRPNRPEVIITTISSVGTT